MKRLAFITLVLLTVALEFVSAKHQRPNFSGHWSMNPPGQVGLATNFVAREFTATQDDKTLTLVRTTSPAVADQPGVKFVFKLDGSPSSNILNNSGRVIPMVSTTKWDGKKLIIVSAYVDQNKDIEGTQTWLLTDSGELRIEQEWTRDGRTTTGEKTYKKN